MKAVKLSLLAIVAVFALASCGSQPSDSAPQSMTSPHGLGSLSIDPTITTLSTSGLSAQATSLMNQYAASATETTVLPTDTNLLQQIQNYADTYGVPSTPTKGLLSMQSTPAPGVVDNYPWMEQRSRRVTWAFPGYGHIIRDVRTKLVRSTSVTMPNGGILALNLYVAPSAVFTGNNRASTAGFTIPLDGGCQVVINANRMPRIPGLQLDSSYYNPKFDISAGTSSAQQAATKKNRAIWTYFTDTLSHELGHCVDGFMNAPKIFGFAYVDKSNHSGLTNFAKAAATWGSYYNNGTEAYAQVFGETVRRSCRSRWDIDAILQPSSARCMYVNSEGSYAMMGTVGRAHSFIALMVNRGWENDLYQPTEYQSPPPLVDTYSNLPLNIFATSIGY